MGGHKQANRTKNNARPSSSSHSAQLLGNTVPTFFGFSALKDGSLGAPGLPTEEAKTNLHSDFQIMFKQMCKKDPTTRFKALQMFTDTCNNLDMDAVVQMLPLWPRMYCTLCTDINHKVREVAHKAHHAVVSKVKKMIAPHLKELAGPWFTSQYDTYPPAASAARLAFQEAFPGDKYKKAIVFCQKEILAYIYDNLINQTPQTLCTPNTSAEDMDAKYERIIISSLQGYNLYLQKLSPDEIEQAIESNKQLLSNPKFWKYSKNKIATIRNSFYLTVITICQNAKFLVADESSRLSSAVFNNLDESDPLVLQSVWEAALNVLVAVENCWSRINIDKQIFSKLFFVLKNGGRNVATIYPSILPLISQLPEDLIKDKETFYKNLFDNLRRGLSLNFVNQSNSDEKIIATTFVECLKYVIIRNISDEEFCVSLVSNQLIPSLKEKLNECKSKKMPTTPFFLQTACLVRYWHSNRNTGNGTYEKLVQIFFSSLFTLFTQHVENDISRSELEDLLNNQGELLIVLSRPDQFSPKHKGRVKFKDDAKEDQPETVELKWNFEGFDGFEVDILPIAKKLGVFYFKNAIDKEEKHYIRPLNKLLAAFNAGVIFEEMTKAVNESTPFKLFTEYFSKWLTREEMKCNELLDLSLKLLKHVTDDEKEYILEEFRRDWFSPDNLELSLNFCKSLSNCFDDQSVVDWVKSEQFANDMIDLVERYVTSDGSDSNLRHFIVGMLNTKTGDGEFIITSAVFDRIVDTVSRKVYAPCDDISYMADISEDLISRSKSEGNVSPFLETLVARLFELSCQRPEAERATQVSKAGLSFILSQCQDSGLEFARKLSKVVKGIVLRMDDDNSNDEGELNFDQIALNVNNYLTLCKDAYSKGSSKAETDIKKDIIKVFFDSETDEWKEEETVKEMEKTCRIGYEHNEDLDFEYLEAVNYMKNSSEVEAPPETVSSFDFKHIKLYAKWNLFVGKVLYVIATDNKTPVMSERLYDGKKEEEKSVVLNNDEEFKSEVVATAPQELEENMTLGPFTDDVSKFLVSVGWFGSFSRYFGSSIYYYQMKDFINKLKTVACDLINSVSLSESQFMYNQCKVFIDKKSTWRLVGNTFGEVFNGDFVEQLEVVEDRDREIGRRYLDEFKELDFPHMTPDPRNHLKISCFVKRGFGRDISDAQWDRIFIYIHNSVDGFPANGELTDFNLLTISAVARLYSKLTNTFNKNQEESELMRISNETCIAWSQLVQTEVYNKFLPAWKLLCEECHGRKDLTPEFHVALENVGEVVAAGTELRKVNDLEANIGYALDNLRFMVSSHAAVQITSFRLCRSLVSSLVQIDTETFGDNVTESRDEDDNIFFKPLNSNCNWVFKQFDVAFKENLGIVELILSDFKFGDSCAGEPFTDSYTYIYWYLQFMCFLMEMCGEAHSHLRHQYGVWLMNSGYVVFFLESVFKLMPKDVLHGTEAKERYHKYFESYGALNFREPVKSERIEQLACYAYRLFLAKLPSLTREWWRQTDSTTSNFVDKVTVQYVSPILVSLEFKNLNRESAIVELVVKTYVNSREVVAEYLVGDSVVSLVLILPTNYPLGTINIDPSCEKSVNSRRLLFRLSRYFLNQNGSIWDALAIWKNNLDMKFHGREECYICFSIVQGSSLEIPRLACYTCKKKFHSSCLYKWFKTSNRSSCPICRNLF